MDRVRCSWVGNDPQMVAYHDEEWGVPEYDGRALWEKLMLDGFQAGLSWSIVLRKREGFRKAFRNFDPKNVARFDESDVSRLLEDPGIIRSRAKIEATIGGARAYLKMQSDGEDFSTWYGTWPAKDRFGIPDAFPPALRCRKRYQRL
jgi:DNA-3-methyladenine glycosylase I